MTIYSLCKKSILTIMVLLLPISIYAATLNDVLSDIKDGRLDNFSIVKAMLIASDFSQQEVSSLNSKVETKIAGVVIAGNTAGKEDKQAANILKKLKSNILKQCVPGSSFELTMKDGKYDPVWGTALFLQALKKSKIKSFVIETPANFLVAVKSSSGETLFDVFIGKNPVKTTFSEFISKKVNLRSSFQVKKFPPFNLSTAKRYDSSRIIAGALAQRLLNDLKNGKYNDYKKIVPKLYKAFPGTIIEQDKIVSKLTSKLKDKKQPKIVIPLAEIAYLTNRLVKVDTKEMHEKAILGIRRAYIDLKNSKKWNQLDTFLKRIKSIIYKKEYLPMAREGNLKIFNYYWKQKKYNLAGKYAKVLYKDLKITKAKPFYNKCILLGAQQLAKQKKYSEALKRLDIIFKVDKNNANAKKIKEWIYQTKYNSFKEENNYPKMLTILGKLRKLSPTNAKYRNSMIRTYWIWGKSFIDKKDFRTGIDKLKSGYRQFKDYAPLKELLEKSYWNFAVNLDKKKKRLIAIKVLKEANDLFGDQSSDQRNDLIGKLYLLLSIDSSKKGKRSEAMDYVDRGLIYSPDNENLLNQKENLKRGKGSIKEEKIEYAPWE